MLKAFGVAQRTFAVMLGTAKHLIHPAQAELRRKTIYIWLGANLPSPPSSTELGGHPDPLSPLAPQDAM